MADKITLGFHSFGTCTTGFAVALGGMIRYSGGLVANIIHVPSPYVTEARNKIVAQWLAKTKSDYLLMLDVDLQFMEDALIQTYFVAKHSRADVLFGCYALGDFRPSLFGPPVEGKSLPTVLPNLEAEQIYEVYAGATGWLLLSREGALKIAEHNEGRHWKWFDHDIENADDLRSGDLYKADNNTIRIGEDFSFCKRARDAGVKIYGTTIPLLIHEKYQPLLPHFMQGVAKKMGLPIRGGADAVGSSTVEVQGGDASVGVEEGKESPQPQTGDSDNAEREAPSGEGQEGVQAIGLSEAIVKEL